MAEEPKPNPLRPAPPAAPLGVGPRPVEKKSNTRRFAAIARRWFRDTFSREQLVSSLRSLVWVAPLTVLIWVYAEREQVAERPAQFQVEIRSGVPGQVVRLADTRSATVMVTVRGPKARVGEAIDSLQAGLPVEVYVAGGRQPGVHDVEILPLIERDPRLEGLTIISGEPKMLRVDIDTVREELLDVKVDPESARLLNGPPTFDPPQVKVSAPSAAFQSAYAKGAVYAEAVLPPEMRAPGRHGPQGVKLKIQGLTGPDVAPRQSTVMATVDVRDADERGDISRIPVRILTTQEFMDEYRVTYSPKFVLNVPVYGSPEVIRQLKTGELSTRPDTFFSVTSAEVSAGKGTRKLEYVLPEGVTMREQDKQTVTFTITRRDGAP